MEKINFYKMSGCGNDFIIIDNRKFIVPENNLPEFAKKICFRRMSVGADGLVLIEDDSQSDFKWRFYNSDGSLAEMCGNAARCTARFAYINKIAGSKMSFKTQAGIISAQIMKNQGIEEKVKIKMTDPENIKDKDIIVIDNKSLPFISLNTGVPHVVIETDDIEAIDVEKIGKKIRFHEKFAPAGTNVNFISISRDNRIIIRTYERGVENETLACGTGCVASVLAAAKESGISSPVACLTRSGNYLFVHYLEILLENRKIFKDVFLEGDARIIYKGELNKDAWNW